MQVEATPLIHGQSAARGIAARFSKGEFTHIIFSARCQAPLRSEPPSAKAFENRPQNKATDFEQPSCRHLDALPVSPACPGPRRTSSAFSTGLPPHNPKQPKHKNVFEATFWFKMVTSSLGQGLVQFCCVYADFGPEHQVRYDYLRPGSFSPHVDRWPPTG